MQQYTIISKLMEYVELRLRLVLRILSERLKGKCEWTSILMILQVIACTFTENAFHQEPSDRSD